MRTVRIITIVFVTTTVTTHFVDYIHDRVYSHKYTAEDRERETDRQTDIEERRNRKKKQIKINEKNNCYYLLTNDFTTVIYCQYNYVAVKG